MQLAFLSEEHLLAVYGAPQKGLLKNIQEPSCKVPPRFPFLYEVFSYQRALQVSLYFGKKFEEEYSPSSRKSNTLRNSQSRSGRERRDAQFGSSPYKTISLAMFSRQSQYCASALKVIKLLLATYDPIHLAYLQRYAYAPSTFSASPSVGASQANNTRELYAKLIVALSSHSSKVVNFPLVCAAAHSTCSLDPGP